MSLSPATGNPPAVTHEQVEAWAKLGDDVAAAMAMGGEQGLDFLVNIMAEWAEAVDDVNTARQICVDLATRGLRDEAIHWHAEGFFDVADRLDPDRPGWEEWEGALRGRYVVTPRVDRELREMANRIHEELELRDLGGKSLAEHLGDLRRNALVRGHLGERLVTLEAVRSLDPASEVWGGMIRPIRRQRVDAIADEVKAAIQRRDFDSLESLRAEVAAHDEGGELPGGVAKLLHSVSQCQAVRALQDQSSQVLAALVARIRDADGQPFGSPLYHEAVSAATSAKKAFGKLHEALVEAVKAASSTPEAASLLAEIGGKQKLRELEATAREPCRWVDHQDERARVHAVASDIEAEVMRVIEAAPEQSSSIEAFESRLRGWRKDAEAVLVKCRKKAARLPEGLPEITAPVFARLQDTRQLLEKHLEGLRRREKLVVAYFLIGLGVVVLLVFVGVVVAVVFK
jgi:NAD(P)H-dependent FMN reductase